MLHRIQTAAVEQNISPRTINSVIQESNFVPEVIRRDRNQPEFTLTMARYISNTVNPGRIQHGKQMKKRYATLLRQVEARHGVQPHVILAFWGMESDYGRFKSPFQLTDSFLSLIYDGRRETFFTNQLIALMRQADRNNLEIREIKGSWAGAMGHFQFIPTTLQQYGVDGDGDGKIDIMNSLPDAMHSAGNFLRRLGWNKNERIVRQVRLPAGFDTSLCDSRTRLHLNEWRRRGVIGVPQANKTAGLVCDDSILPTAYLAYENFYRIKRWNNSNFYAVAIALLADELR
jgi:membrane-bound lytic murein transglycosylase B